MNATSSERDVDALIDGLLADHDPTDTDPQQFWGAQYDCGLAMERSYQLRVQERLTFAGAPDNRWANFVGLSMVAPTLCIHGTHDQRRNLRPIFTTTQLWCQLFSEPDAGSDLASLRTSARRVGDEWIVNGCKVWTTNAHLAHKGLLLARTDSAATRHAGISCFLLDMDAAGVEIHPLRQMSGQHDFNEVTLTDVHLPADAIVAAPGDGWRVALGTLANERFAFQAMAQRAEAAVNESIAATAYRVGATQSRNTFTELYLRAKVLGWLVSRLTGQHVNEPGPSTNLIRVAAGELERTIANKLLDLHGAYGSLLADPAGDVAVADAALSFLNSPQYTIGGGTTEVTRNLIAERVLGLPR